MNLDFVSDPADLYLARGPDEVNVNRPFFTGDVFRDVDIPGVQQEGMGIIVAHPCSFRSGSLVSSRLMLAAVAPFRKEGAGAWRRGLADLMPLQNLDGGGYWAAHLDKSGRASVERLVQTERVACLNLPGINMLQQRLTFHLTRAEVPTATFNEAFAHTFEEADLLEEWSDRLTATGTSADAAAVAFEAFMRDGDPSFQQKLRDPQQRPSVRKACRLEASRRAADDH